MTYIKRIVEEELVDKLLAAGAVLIKGPKSCGKTETGMRHAKSVLYMDRDPQIEMVMNTQPDLLLQGETPRLLDEWQEFPLIWNYVRHAVDDRKAKGQFILTGSANPVEEVKLHSGAGRFAVIQMDTMTWQELGYSSGKISLSNLLNQDIDNYFEQTTTSLDDIIHRICIGGWPTLIGENTKSSLTMNRSYIDLLCDTDMSRVSGVKRDPSKVRSLIRSLARNISTLVDNGTLEKDVRQVEKNDISRNTVKDYLDTLSQLMILYEQPAFNTHIRSAASLRKSPKRHFCDPSLAVAALGLNEKSLKNDLRFTGFLFESLAIHELNVYAKANDATVFHYNDSYGLEVDAIVQQRNGNYAAFEIKLGIGHIEEAASNLIKFRNNIDTQRTPLPTSLNVITGTGMSFKRNDGVNVISLASLGK